MTRLLCWLFVIHAIFFHIRGSKTKSKDGTEEENWVEENHDFTSFDSRMDADNNQHKEQLMNEPEEISEYTEDYQTEQNEYPMYQEYPVGSGNQWVRYSEDRDWELVE